MHVRPNFDDLEFFELIWMHERMADQRRAENEDHQKQQGNLSITDVLGGQDRGR